MRAGRRDAVTFNGPNSSWTSSTIRCSHSRLAKPRFAQLTYSCRTAGLRPKIKKVLPSETSITASRYKVAKTPAKPERPVPEPKVYTRSEGKAFK